MSRRDRRAERLGAYLDGELGSRAGRRVEAALAGSPEARAELEGLRRVGSLVREAVSEAPVAEPDLWDAIARRLPAIDAERAEAAEARRGFFGGLLRPVLATAAVALLLAAGLLYELGGKEPPSRDVVQWLDPEAPVMVLQTDDETTIIWMLGPASDEVSGGSDGVAA